MTLWTPVAKKYAARKKKKRKGLSLDGTCLKLKTVTFLCLEISSTNALLSCKQYFQSLHILCLDGISYGDDDDDLLCFPSARSISGHENVKGNYHGERNRSPVLKKGALTFEAMETLF